jgi:opacity protein-like surface antigen
MKALLAAALILAGASSASAAPWQTDVIEADGQIVGSTAYQWVEGEANVLLGYECDEMFGLEALYVQTEERYEETTSYAPDVPTTFTVDGKAYQFTGIFQNRDGYLFTYYDGIDGGFYELIDSMLVATGTITVAFYDKSYSFSTEGIREAMRQASEPCF